MVAQTTKLDAVNAALAAAGRQPISSLSGTLTAGPAAIVRFIDDALRQVQSRGWHFNTEYDLTLTADVNDQFAVPPDVLELAPRSAASYEIREGFIYDLDNRTDVFTIDTLQVDVIYLKEFEVLPEQFRALIGAIATYKFVCSYVKDPTTIAVARDELKTAWADVNSKDIRQGRYNIFHSQPAREAMSRRKPRWG